MMKGLIQKSGYIKPGGGAGSYTEYIATRDGVELIDGASQYMEYIAERPRSHGLFSGAEHTDLERTMREVSSHPAPVWTFIYSLKREDAVRLGYNSAESWRKLILAHQVDAIVDELARIPAVAECYEVWNNLRDELENYYKDKPRQRLPLSQQKEFKSIKNMVIQEAERIRLDQFTFEDEQMDDEREKEVWDFHTHWQIVSAYQEAKFILCDDDATWAEQEEAVRTLEQLWESGFPAAAHQLGRCWRDGLGVYPNDEKAELWFRRSSEAGNEFSQYALGKLLQSQKRIEKAVSWYQKAAAQGNQYASYRLGKLYLQGDGVPKDVDKAIDYLTCSAESGNPYAQYTLGKLYLSQDLETAWEWLSKSAAKGNEHAQFFLDRWESLKPPSVMLSVTRLLHHISKIFQKQVPTPPVSGGIQIDRKRLQQLKEKKIAMGHRPDDHEEYSGPSMSI